jgi:hypothetical protein
MQKKGILEMKKLFFVATRLTTELCLFGLTVGLYACVSKDSFGDNKIEKITGNFQKQSWKMIKENIEIFREPNESPNFFKNFLIIINYK